MRWKVCLEAGEGRAVARPTGKTRLQGGKASSAPPVWVLLAEAGGGAYLVVITPLNRAPT
jgi:hypothetical protein